MYNALKSKVLETFRNADLDFFNPFSIASLINCLWLQTTLHFNSISGIPDQHKFMLKCEVKRK